MRQYLRLLRLQRNRRHRAIVRMAHRALHDERGGEILEYSLIIGLIVVGSVATITCVGSKVLTKWNSVNSGV
ncbi:MAG TPA: hypothetical protein VFE58_18090 [Tepidisphaeraceae bacterium]|nr:hypothetical protein [Tepidisphaeraceae bacterium]